MINNIKNLLNKFSLASLFFTLVWLLIYLNYLQFNFEQHKSFPQIIFILALLGAGFGIKSFIDQKNRILSLILILTNSLVAIISGLIFAYVR